MERCSLSLKYPPTPTHMKKRHWSQITHLYKVLFGYYPLCEFESVDKFSSSNLIFCVSLTLAKRSTRFYNISFVIVKFYCI